MGYRSDVMIAFYLRGQRDYSAEHPKWPMLKLWFEENYMRDQALEPETLDYMPERGAILVSYVDIKWYQGYPEIDHVHNMMGQFTDTFRADDEDGDGSYEFIRIGEEVTDIDQGNSDWCDFVLGVRREMYSDL